MVKLPSVTTPIDPETWEQILLEQKRKEALKEQGKPDEEAARQARQETEQYLIQRAEAMGAKVPPPTPAPTVTPKPSPVTIDVSKLPRAPSEDSMGLAILSEQVPPAVLEQAGLVYPWQRTPAAIAEAMKKWRETQARKAEVHYIKHYKPEKEIKHIKTLEERIEKKMEEIPELGFEVHPEHVEKIETLDRELQEAYGRYESEIEAAMIAIHGVPPVGKTWLELMQFGGTTARLPPEKMEEIGKFWVEEVQPRAEAYYGALAGYVELPGVALPTSGAPPDKAFEEWQTELTTRLGKIEEVQAPITEANRAIEEMNKEIGRYESYVGITEKIAAWEYEHSIMGELDRIGESVSIPNPLAALEKELFPQLGFGSFTIATGKEIKPLKLITEPIMAGLAVVTTPFRWLGMAEPGPIGLAMEAGIMGLTGGLGWQEEEIKRIEEEANWLREHPGYAIGATLGDILAMKVVGKAAGWAGGKVKAGVRLTAKKILPEGVKWELITRQQNIARWLGLPEEYVKVRTPVFVSKTKEAWMKAVTEGGKGYAEVGGAVSEIFKPAPRWLVPKWMEKLMPSLLRTKYYAAQVVRGAAKPEWMTKSAYEALVKSAAEYIIKWEGPMLTQTFRTVSAGAKKGIALAIAQQSERFALAVGMHSPSVAGVSSELASLWSRMVPTQFMFVDTLTSSLAKAAAGMGAGLASKAWGVSADWGMPKAPARGIPEIQEYELLEMQEQLMEEIEVQGEAVNEIDDAMKRAQGQDLGRTQGLSQELERAWGQMSDEMAKLMMGQAPAQAPAQTSAQALKQMQIQLTRTMQAQKLQMRTLTSPFRFPLFPFVEEVRGRSPRGPPFRKLRTEPRLRIWELGKIEKMFKPIKFKMPKFEEPKTAPVRVRKRRQPKSTVMAEMDRLALAFGNPGKGRRRR